MISYEDWIQNLTRSQMEFIKDNKKIVIKWGKLIEEYLDMNLHKDVLEILCIYFETYCMYDDLFPRYSSDGTQIFNLESELLKIKQNIIELFKNKKSTILRKVFNYETGFAEYELEDGNFIRIMEDGKLGSIKFNIFQFLPKSFIKIINPNEYRNQQINSVLDVSRKN